MFDAYLTGHNGDLYITDKKTTAPAHDVYQLVAEMGKGASDPNTYLQIRIHGNTITVTPIFRRQHDSDNWTVGTPTTWTKAMLQNR